MKCAYHFYRIVQIPFGYTSIKYIQNTQTDRFHEIKQIILKSIPNWGKNIANISSGFYPVFCVFVFGKKKPTNEQISQFNSIFGLEAIEC